MQKILFFLLMLAAVVSIEAKPRKDRPCPNRRGMITEDTDGLSGIYTEFRYRRISSVYSKDCWVEVWNDKINQADEPCRLDVYVKADDGGWRLTNSFAEHQKTGLAGLVVATGVTCNVRKNCTVRLIAEWSFVRIEFLDAQGKLISSRTIDWGNQHRRTYTPPIGGVYYER